MNILNTTEVRWFSQGQIPAEVQSWFDRLGVPIAQPERTDRYLPHTGSGLGIKLREGRLEIKVRTSDHGSQVLATGVAGKVESWVKWGFSFPLHFSGWTPVRKARQILFYQVTGEGEVMSSTPEEMPDQGGGIELTQVCIGEEPWWTIGIEVFGPAGGREDVLTRIAAHVFAVDGSPILGTKSSIGYSAWLTGFSLRP